MDFSSPISAVIPSLDGEVLTVLARTLKPLTGSRVAELVPRASKSGVAAVLRRLEGQGLVLAETAGRASLFQANREHLLWQPIESLVRSADTAFVELQHKMTTAFAAEMEPELFSQTTMAIFGSVARGTSSAESDIDIVVVFPDNADPELGLRAVDVVTDRVQRWTGNQCNVYTANDERLARMFAEQDPMLSSWEDDAATFHGVELNRRVRAATRLMER